MTSSTCSTHHFPSFSEGLSLRPPRSKCSPAATPPFPFLFGRAFIEAVCRRVSRRCYLHFPSFSEGLSLRLRRHHPPSPQRPHFPSFSEGLSLRLCGSGGMSECLSYFPSFSEGLSLRPNWTPEEAEELTFPFLFGRAFIEARWTVET